MRTTDSRRGFDAASMIAILTLLAGCEGAMAAAPDSAVLADTGTRDAGDRYDAGDDPIDAGTTDGGTPMPDPDAGLPEPEPCPRARVQVAAGEALNLRPDPSTAGTPLAAIPNHTIVDVLARVRGEPVGGDDEWLQVRYRTDEGYVSAVFAECTTDEAPVLTLDGFYLPLACGTSARISQGNDGAYSHSGRTRYAYDFAIPVGVPLVAMADGIVHRLYDATGPGDACYDGGGSSCFPYANLVVLMHADGRTSIYKHLSEVSVSLGELVPRGRAVGLSGSTGYSTGPHAHVMLQEDCGADNCQSLPLVFEDVPGDGIPDTNQTVTSGNCP